MNIIELREKEATSTYNNGDFTTNLKEPIQLNEGDSLILKSCFIDSVEANDNKIKINDDITGYVEICPYICDWYTTGKEYNGGVIGLDITDFFPNGKIFTASRALNPTPPANLKIYNYINVPIKNGYVGKWGGVSIQFSYKDYENNDATLNIDVPELDANKLEFNFNIQKDTPGGNGGAFVDYIGTSTNPANDMTLLSDKSELINKYNIDIEEFLNNAPAVFGVFGFGPSSPAGASTGGYLQPFKKQIPFIVKQGNYTQADLCQIINEQISDNRKLGFDSFTGAFQPSQSNLLMSNTQIRRELNLPNLAADKLYYVSEDGQDVFDFPYADPSLNPDYWVGSDQLEFVYDSTLDRVKIISSHMALNDDSGNPINKFIYPTTGPISDQYLIANKNSGVLITDLQPANFWADNLGFLSYDTPQRKSVISKHITVPNFTKGNITDMSIYKWKADPSEILDGVKTTGQLTSTASCVERVAAGVATFWIVPAIPVDLVSSTTDTTAIYSNKDLKSSVENDGYYLIEISGITNNNFISENDINNNLQAIVSKYFNVGSYTSGNQDSGILYTHKGAPMNIQNLKVRILDSNKELSQNIGPDNTIFISVIRGQNN